MKSIIFFLTFIFIFSCNTAQKEIKTPKFLVGNWIRTNNKPNQTTYEFWKDDLTGIGFTLQHKDTIFKEELAIITQNDSTFLRVTGVNEQPTFFKFTSQTDSSFICENPKNKFPKKIHYVKENQQLKAKVSSDEFEIDFVFDPLN